MSKIKKSMSVKVLSTFALTGMLLGVAVTPAMAARGDFYDTTAHVHYSVAGLTSATRSDLISAYVNGNKFLKEQASGTFLDYNGAYDKLAQELGNGKTAADAILAIAADPTLHPTTVDTTAFTEAGQMTDFHIISIE